MNKLEKENETLKAALKFAEMIIHLQKQTIKTLEEQVSSLDLECDRYNYAKGM
jgi:hypothetical protein